jgi:hypothetical protein
MISLRLRMILPWKTVQDVSKSSPSTAGLQRPAKRKSDCEHVTGSDVAVINRKHSNINLLVQKKITKKKKSAQEHVYWPISKHWITPSTSPMLYLWAKLVQCTTSSRTHITFPPPWRYTTHSGCVFYSPLSGFSLLAYEVTWSHTATRHIR